jgi:PKD repeat protein
MIMNLLVITTHIYAAYSPNAGPDQYTLSGQVVTLSGSFDASYLSTSDPQYEWDFGDGSPLEVGTPASTTVTVTHIYVGSPGDTFAATFRILIDRDTDEYESDIVLIIINQPPVADADGPYMVAHGSPVQLDGSSSYDPDGTIVLWEWDLDNDGTYDATGETVTHTFPSIATYPVTIRVTDDLGQTDTDTTIVTVGPEFVIPEYPLGTITFILTALTALVLRALAWKIPKESSNINALSSSV